MEDFALTVKNGQLREKLTDALHGRKPFGNFKRVLLDYPEEREQWFKHEAEARREQILEWAESEGLEVNFDK